MGVIFYTMLLFLYDCQIFFETW